MQPARPSTPQSPPDRVQNTLLHTANAWLAQSNISISLRYRLIPTGAQRQERSPHSRTMAAASPAIIGEVEYCQDPCQQDRQDANKPYRALQGAGPAQQASQGERACRPPPCCRCPRSPCPRRPASGTRAAPPPRACPGGSIKLLRAEASWACAAPGHAVHGGVSPCHCNRLSSLEARGSSCRPAAGMLLS